MSKKTKGSRVPHVASRVPHVALAVGLVLAGTALYAASQPKAHNPAPKAHNPAASQPKGYKAVVPEGQQLEKEQRPSWPRRVTATGQPVKPDALPSIVFYECWAGGPIVADPKECPEKEHGGYRLQKGG